MIQSDATVQYDFWDMVQRGAAPYCNIPTISHHCSSLYIREYNLLIPHNMTQYSHNIPSPFALPKISPQLSFGFLFTRLSLFHHLTTHYLTCTDRNQFALPSDKPSQTGYILNCFFPGRFSQIYCDFRVLFGGC